MAKIDDVNKALDDLQAKTAAKLQAIMDAIAALKAGGSGATDAQLDALMTKVAAISAAEDVDTDADPNTPA